MFPLLPAFLTSLAATSSPVVLITEIMYDPASPERKGEPEWVEIANLGPTPVDLSGWRLDDEDSTDWGILDGSLEAGGVAILINGDAASRDDFLEAWTDDPDADAGYLVIPVSWGSLANKPSDTNEILQLLDAESNVICEVNYGRGKDWPDPGRRGQSIYLEEADPDLVSKADNWSLTERDMEGSRVASGSEVYVKPDIGSPGHLPWRRPVTPGTPMKPRRPVTPGTPMKPPPLEKPSKPSPAPIPAEDEDDIPY